VQGVPLPLRVDYGVPGVAEHNEQDELRSPHQSSPWRRSIRAHISHEAVRHETRNDPVTWETPGSYQPSKRESNGTESSFTSNISRREDHDSDAGMITSRARSWSGASFPDSTLSMSTLGTGAGGYSQSVVSSSIASKPPCAASVGSSRNAPANQASAAPTFTHCLPSRQAAEPLVNLF
jgi:hypothetical protein